jgi:hypothetical protein
MSEDYMALANSVVGFLSGTVAYADNEVGSFHCQIESPDLVNTLIWSIDGVDSKIVTGEMYNLQWYYPLANLIAGVGFSNGFAWVSTVPTNPRHISDVVIHLNLTYTLDDGSTCPVSATYEQGAVVYHTPVPPTLPSNISAFLADLTTMIEQAVTTCTFDPHN